MPYFLLRRMLEENAEIDKQTYGKSKKGGNRSMSASQMGSVDGVKVTKRKKD